MHPTAEPLVIAHRGEARFRENTVAAVEAAMMAGADAVEIDVQLAADGTVVAVHDDTFERIWDDPRPVAAMTWDDIERLGNDEFRVPRLVDLLEVSRVTGTPLVLDQKHPVAAMAAARLVERTGAGETAFCGSTEGLVEIRRAYGDATIFLNDSSFTPPDIRVLAAVRPQYYNPEWSLLSPSTVQAMRTFGIRTCCWTPNDDAELRLVLDLGVDAVMTDRPQALRSILDDRAESAAGPVGTAATTTAATTSRLHASVAALR